MKAFRAFALNLIAALLLATPALAQQITVYSSGSVAVGQTRQLTAYVPLSPNTVTWSVNGLPGGDATVGTVSATGLYQAPAVVPMANAVTVRATSTADASKSGAVTITVTQPPVQLWSISPTFVPAGAYSIRINGANITSSSVVYAGDTALKTTVTSSTSATANGTAAADMVGKKLNITVRNPGLGGTISSAVQLEVRVASGETTPSSTEPAGVRVSLSPTSATLALSATQQFTATVTGATDTSVVYTVNGVLGGNDAVGTISNAGLYRAPAAAPSAPVTIRAASNASSTAAATAIVTIAGPVNAGNGLGTANLAAARLLEQATFGPTPAEIAHIKQVGVNAWLDEQFNTPETAIPDPGGMLSGQVQQQYLNRLSIAPDQLRQRVAYALAQIIVISMNKNIYPNEIVPYLQILSKNAFGNYRTLLGEITVSSQMGKYLDMANSNKPAGGSGANENYPRELMQLFSIGLYKLNPDGSRQLDAQGAPVPAYDQTTVQQVALALTGWTFPGPRANNWENFTGPMQPVEANHDTRQKSFLGCTLLPGQPTVQDKDATLDCIFKHPNVGPFISTRLIRNMVTSNPSPGYVQRVSAVFDNNGSGVRGDLKAVVRAILTDAEARDDATVPSAGRLRDPIQHVAAFVRALNGKMQAANGLPWQFSQMAQTPLTPPSVFGFYSPLYRIPKSTQMGPEFQIYAPTESVLRGNMFWQIISGPGGDFTTDLIPFTAVAGDTVKLIDAVDQAVLYGRMPQAMRQSLANAITAQGDATSRMQTALYLTALSGFYAVQY